MAKINYEEVWISTETEKHKELLLQWVKEGNILDSDEGFIFVLPKVVEMNDDELTKEFSDYAANHSHDFVKRIKDAEIAVAIKDKIIAIILESLSNAFSTRYEDIISFRYLLNNPDYPETKRVLRNIDTLKYDLLMNYLDQPFLLGTDLDEVDFKNYFDGKGMDLFAFTISYEVKRYMDLMFMRKDFKRLGYLYRIFEKMEKTKELNANIVTMVSISSLDNFENFQYVRSKGDPNIDQMNYLFVRMANYVHWGDELSTIQYPFFLQLSTVFEDIIAEPSENHHDEIMKCFYQIDKLNDRLLDQFLEFLFLHKFELSEKIHQEILEISSDNKGNNPFPPRVSEAFKNKNRTRVSKKFLKRIADGEDVMALHEFFKKVEGQKPEENSAEISAEKSEEKSQNKESAEISNWVVKESKYFDDDIWGMQRGFLIIRMLNSNNVDVSDQLGVAFDNIADHARRHLQSDGTSPRAKAGQQKYLELVELFHALSPDPSREGNPGVEGLEHARETLMEYLDKDPKKSDLLKNRGGFFGAYKTVSKCLSAVGMKHYQYKNRTAESTTDHLLIALLDTINEELNVLRVEL